MSSPRSDREEEETNVPDVVRSFISKFTRALRSKHAHDLQSLYDSEFNDLSERYFNNAEWPSPSNVAPLVKDDQNILLLYRELYYRHIEAKSLTSLQHRLGAFQNYVDLFNVILGLNAEHPEFELPLQWLWDLTDEFIYQFQTFYNFKNKAALLSEPDAQLLKQHENHWSVQTMYKYLDALVKKGVQNTNTTQSATQVPDSPRSASGEEKKEEQTQAGSVSNMFRALSQFSMVGLLRLNCMLGDYTSGLAAIATIDLRKRSPATSLTACHSTLFYNLGFAYMMTSRYVDAAKTFSNFIREASRNKFSMPRSYQAQAIHKRTDQMHALLAITVNLAPQRLEESIHNALREKYQDQMQALQRGEVEKFVELFNSSCPKFVTISPSTSSDNTTPHMEAHNLQVKLFRREVEQRHKLAEIFSFLKLCTTVDVAKLANFLDTDEDSALTLLLCLKHKNRNLRATASYAADFTGSADVEFYVDRDVVHVVEDKPPRRYGEFFIKNILKLDHMLGDFRSVDQSKSS